MIETTSERGSLMQPYDDSDHEGRDKQFMDIDRMVNEGLGGGIVSEHNGLIEETTTDTMQDTEHQS